MSAIYFALTENWEKKMKNKNKMLLCCFLVILTLLPGCSLAKEDGLGSESTRLIGVYITAADIFSADNEDFIPGNNDLWKVSAELKEYTYTDPVTGGISQRFRYEFAGIEGFELFLVTVKEPDGSSYVSLMASDVFSGIHSSIAESSSVEGMLYVTPDFSDVLYMNPVYQNSRGEVYMTSGSGYNPASHIEGSQGERFSMTISEEHKETVNGESSISGMSVKIRVGVKFRPTGINIIQVDEKSSVTDIKKYSPEAPPEKIFPARKTQYLIAEIHSSDYEGKPYVYREIIEAGTEYTGGSSADESGVFRNFAVHIVWADGAAEN